MLSVKNLHNDIIGEDQVVSTPFGIKPLVYADYTASGRSVRSIEAFIEQDVLPFFANTHTEHSFTGAQTTKLREQARQIIKDAIGANNNDALIFCGSGSTAAIDKLIGLLGLRNSSKQCDKPVVFIGPYEHHSNELPWRESCAEVVTIPLDRDGHIDEQLLQETLIAYQDRTIKIGSFSAASNVTGVQSNTSKITKILHQYNALAFWDFAASAPYVDININGEQPYDGVFISTHKFVGGPGTPGILAIKKHVCSNPSPVVAGGGTVSYVSPTSHCYHTNIETREEAGTPDIVGAIRAGLVFKLKNHIGIETIKRREHEQLEFAEQVLGNIENITILGNETKPRLPIFSLRFHFKRAKKTFELHPGYVTALLSDLFGIQARAGCSCAGPYGHYLLKINNELSKRIQTQIDTGYGCLKPGWVRFNLNYFIPNDERNYILEAIKLIAEHGDKFLRYYQLDVTTGVWSFQGQKRRMHTDLNDFLNDKTFDNKLNLEQPATQKSYSTSLNKAKALLESPPAYWSRIPTPTMPTEAAKIRWFLTQEDLVDNARKNPLKKLCNEDSMA